MVSYSCLFVFCALGMLLHVTSFKCVFEDFVSPHDMFTSTAPLSRRGGLRLPQLTVLFLHFDFPIF